MLSKKTQYALQALSYMAEQGGMQPILIAEIELGKELNQTIDDYKISLYNALLEANHVSEL